VPGQEVLGDSDEVRDVVHPLVELLLRDLLRGDQRLLDYFLYSQSGVQGPDRVLQHDPDVLPQIGEVPLVAKVDLLPEEPDGARRRLVEADEYLGEGGFT